ncbi:MAG: NERD domain-containing protein [Anaerolinea sp.]|mgnify:CR=1 FL=1|nr:NERD domain-containing protein [Anaerolinea sp.]
MRSLNPTRARNRRQIRLTTLAFVMAAIGVFACTISIVLVAIPLVNTQSPSYGLYTLTQIGILIFGFLLAIVAVILVIRAFTLKPDNDLARMTSDMLQTQLDDRYTFVRNVNRPGVGYIDAVLVGPPGVLVFRIIDRAGDFINEGAAWIKRGRNGELSSAGFNVTNEALTDIRALRSFLTRSRLKEVPVYGVVVFTRSERELRITPNQPAVPPTHLHNLITTLKQGYFAADRIDATQAQTVVTLLMGG